MKTGARAVDDIEARRGIPIALPIAMHLFVRSRIIAGCAAIACVSVLSACGHRGRDPVYVDRVQVRVDEHARDVHHDDRHDDRHDDHH